MLKGARPTHYSLLILAGGQGRRMQGQDKGLIERQGRPMIAHIVDALADDADEVLISCNRNQAHYAQFGRTLIDTIAGFPGPLAGVLSGLEAARNSQLLIVPCDNPQPPPTLFAKLSHGAQQTGIRFAYDGQRDQYLYALIPRAEAGSLRDYLDRGQRSVKGWYAERGAQAVDLSDLEGSFCNLNRPDSLNTPRP